MSAAWRIAAAALVLALSAIARAAGAPPVPWLVIDPSGGSDMAQYGYRDRASGQMTIPATWADARPFQNGFAVVGKRHFDGDRPDGVRYGVIDEHGKTVIAPDYDGIELVTQGALTLAFLRTEYDAWWRFWEWNWHFSLLGSSPPIT